MKKEIFDTGEGIWYENEKYTKIIPNGTYKIYIDGSYNSCQIIKLPNQFLGMLYEEYYDFTKFHNNLIKLGVTPLADRMITNGYYFEYNERGIIELTDEELKLLENTDYANYIKDNYLYLCDIIKPFKYEYVYDKEYIAIFKDGYICINDKNHYLINNGDAHIYYDTDAIVDVNNDKFIKDFVYKVDDSNKLNIKTDYDSIDEFFDSDFQNNIKLDTLVICSIDTKIPLIKLEKVEKENKLNYRFIVDITIDNGDNFSIKSTIETQEQLSQKLEQTIEALKQYPEFSKYADDLEDCL